MKNKPIKITAGIALATSLMAAPTASAATNIRHTAKPTVATKGIITAPTCNNIKSNYPNPGFTMQKAEIFTGTQYTTLKMTFDKNITANKIKNTKYYKDGAAFYVNLEATMKNGQWGSLYYDVRSNTAAVYTWNSKIYNGDIYNKKVYSNVTYTNNIMRITFPRMPLNITNTTQFSTELIADYYNGEPNGIVTPYYDTMCKTNKYPY